MNKVTYDAGTMTIEVYGLDGVAYMLGDLKSKTPAVVKTAVNATARKARKLMIAQASARYAVNAAGRRHLKDLKSRKKATNSSLSAELFVASMRNDLSYFRTSPASPTHFTGAEWVRGPKVWKGKVLKASPMRKLPGAGNRSKAFLAEFHNRKADGTSSNHIGMVQRVIGSHSSRAKTQNGHDRWRNKQGDVEKLVTLGSPSITAMHHTIWPYVEPETSEYLQEQLFQQTERVLARAKAKQRLMP